MWILDISSEITRTPSGASKQPDKLARDSQTQDFADKRKALIDQLELRGFRRVVDVGQFVDAGAALTIVVVVALWPLFTALAASFKLGGWITWKLIHRFKR
jgi:hypothetical protein